MAEVLDEHPDEYRLFLVQCLNLHFPSAASSSPVPTLPNLEVRPSTSGTTTASIAAPMVAVVGHVLWGALDGLVLEAAAQLVCWALFVASR